MAVSALTDAVMASSVARRVALGHGFLPTRAAEIAIVVSELATNIFRHGGGRGEIALEMSDEGLWIIARDHGPGPSDQPRRPVPAGLGEGLAAARRLTDVLAIERSLLGGFQVRALKRLSLDETMHAAGRLG